MNSPTIANKKFVLLLVFFVFCFSITAKAQTEDTEKLKSQAAQFLQQNNYIEALPILEKLAVAEPDNANIQFFLGFCLVTKSVDTKDAAVQKQLRARARAILVKARDLGRNDAIVNSLIDTIAPDGSENAAAAKQPEEPKYSDNAQANSLMEQGEAAFSRGKNEEALKFYKQALDLDPKLYYAALYSGDVYGQSGDYANAEIWYQKAIAIDPLIETAYRYSATPLMKQGKYEAARDRYIESFISNPFSRLAVGGLGQWADVMKKVLEHPKIGFRKDIDTGTTEKDEEDGSIVWTAYINRKALWQSDKTGKLSENFSKAFPNEKVYRHSLAEELDALNATVKLLKEKINDKNSKIKNLNPSLVKLIDLHDKGLLEPYILFVRTDEGIAGDYMPYLKANRAKLRQYVLEYVISKTDTKD